MNITFHRRAEIALRSLPQKDRALVDSAVTHLTMADPKEIFGSFFLHQLIHKDSSKRLYSYKKGTFRLILSFKDDTCTIEDIVDKKHLKSALLERPKK